MTRPLVAFVLTDSPIKPSGGLGVRFAKLLPYLEEAFDCIVYCNGIGGMSSKTECLSLKAGGPVHGCSPSLFWTEQIADYQRQRRSPTVVVATDYSAIIPGKTLARYSEAKFVVEFDLAYFSFRKTLNEQELTPELQTYSKIMSNIEELGVKSADLVVGCSEFYRRELPWPTKRSVAIPNGINFEEWTGDFTPHVFEGGFKKNLVFIGRMNSQKGIQALLDFQMKGGQMVSRDDGLKLPPDIALHFVGGPVAGDQYKAVVETAAKNPQKFHVPFISGKEKVALLRTCDGVIFPSKHEPFGIVGLEAMAAGAPLITTGVGGIGDYATPGVNCLGCDLTATSIRGAIDQLQSLGSSERFDLIDRAKATAKAFSWRAASDKFIAEIKALC